MRVARVAGIESEMELAYAALQQLCAQMLDGRHRVIEFVLVEIFVGHSDVLHQKSEGQDLRDFERALDLIQRIDAAALVRVDEVDRV